MASETRKPFFGLDCMIMQDPKTRRMLRSQYQHAGVLAYVAILGRTFYENRAYSVADENFIFAVSEDMNITEEELRGIIAFACKIGLFDSDLYSKHNVLTSAAMQRRFCDEQVARRRSKIDIPEDFILVDKGYLAAASKKLIQKPSKRALSSLNNSENLIPFSENGDKFSENLGYFSENVTLSPHTPLSIEERREEKEKKIFLKKEIIEPDGSFDPATMADETFAIYNANNPIDVRKECFRLRLMKFEGRYTKIHLERFFNYWTKEIQGGLMMFEENKAFDLKKKLASWRDFAEEKEDQRRTKEAEDARYAKEVRERQTQEEIRKHDEMVRYAQTVDTSKLAAEVCARVCGKKRKEEKI